jgi:mRNA interferase HigB
MVTPPVLQSESGMIDFVVPCSFHDRIQNVSVGSFLFGTYCSRTGNFVCFSLNNQSNEALRVISRKTLVQFWTEHRDAEQSLKAWFKEVELARWSSPNELKQHYPTASILNSNRLVFNIKGNKYWLIAMINFDYGQVIIRFVGTHAEYDKIDATMI